jgi:Holliday junction resolvasome RuvABC endonuclease subunit
MTAPPKVAGLDLSITATGVTHTVADAPCWHLVRTRGTKDDRLVVIRNQVRTYVLGAELVLIEGYLNHSKSAGITGMVHGAVRSMLIEQGIPYATLPPSSLKKYATGNGGSKTDKRAMALAAYKRAEVEFTDDNTCDAWWLWVAACDYLGSARFVLPALNRESLGKINKEG